MAKYAKFQTLLFAFVTLGILAAGAAVVSFAMMCRHHIRHLHDNEGGIQICKAVYRPGDHTMAFAEVLRMVLAFVAIVTVFVFCGVCCCYRLKVARDQTNHLKAVLKSYNLGLKNDDMNKEFQLYVSTALKSHLADSHVSILDTDVKVDLTTTPETVTLPAEPGDKEAEASLLSSSDTEASSSRSSTSEDRDDQSKLLTTTARVKNVNSPEEPDYALVHDACHVVSNSSPV